MEKKYYEAQILHNRFIRNAIASICKIFLWGFAYGFILGITVPGLVASSANLTVSYYSSSSSKNTEFSPEFFICAAIIIITTLVYALIVIGEVYGIIKENKNITKIENKKLKLESINIDSVKDKDGGTKTMAPPQNSVDDTDSDNYDDDTI